MDQNTYFYYKSIFDEIKEETMRDNWDMNPDLADKHRKEVKKHMRRLIAEYGPEDGHVKYLKEYMDWWLR